MRSRFLPLTAFLVLAVFLQSQAQTDSANFTWSTTSKKIDETTYELRFSASSLKGWYVYSPNQAADLQTTELRFEDSSVVVDGKFMDGPGVKKAVNGLFGEANTYASDIQFSARVRFKDKESIPARLKGELLYSYGKEPDVFFSSIPYSFSVELEGGQQAATRIHISTIDISRPAADCGDNISNDTSYLGIFLLGFLGGLIALLTPCVFPMIPLTVSFFTAKQGERSKGTFNAMLYGFFIFLIYVLITVPFHIASRTDPAIFNNLSTNVWLNLVFFCIFVVFAISFFGAFEITLPSGLANKANSKSGLGKIGGIFFMALTLAIVSFSCTGPILGTLLAGVANEGAWPLTTGAAGFGLALGLPFALFALFPRWLQSIPRSGGWMTDVKVVLGFVELGLAFKFLGNADNVMQLGILKREVLVAFWILVSAAIVVYLMGWIRISHSVKPKRFSPGRIFFIAFFSLITVYLLPGLSNTRLARLNLISGFPPPLCYSLYKNPVNCDKPLLNYEDAIRLAKEQNKPVLIDFTGWACVNCRRMEENVWTNKRVDELMKKEFILVSLYVDEKTKLPAKERTVFTDKNGTEKSIITVGDKWTAFQLENFDATSQPQYAILDTKEQALVKPKFYTPDPAAFAAWLQCGLDAFRAGK